ncbi:translation initiation factor IF-2-like [Melozone crissalis]|uniref:translation initiation factor IF-2-like n=1 Tax=Melozone crissalis TaxID=40204 RepID=UPI0023DAF4B0|nr:translation initiation factor IF-2-like [Melozone crissalis]
MNLTENLKCILSCERTQAYICAAEAALEVCCGRHRPSTEGRSPAVLAAAGPVPGPAVSQRGRRGSRREEAEAGCRRGHPAPPWPRRCRSALDSRLRSPRPGDAARCLRTAQTDPRVANPANGASPPKRRRRRPAASMPSPRSPARVPLVPGRPSRPPPAALTRSGGRFSPAALRCGADAAAGGTQGLPVSSQAERAPLCLHNPPMPPGPASPSASAGRRGSVGPRAGTPRPPPPSRARRRRPAPARTARAPGGGSGAGPGLQYRRRPRGAPQRPLPGKGGPNASRGSRDFRREPRCERILPNSSGKANPERPLAVSVRHLPCPTKIRASTQKLIKKLSHGFIHFNQVNVRWF